VSVDDADTETWLALARPTSKLREGTLVDVGPVVVEVVSRDDEAGMLRVRLRTQGGVSRALEAHGHVPLPPYVRRPDSAADAQRYQTIFARHAGSIAAPTAALHVTPETLARLSARKVELAFVTLHVGIGTFRPVSTEDLDQHPMHEEEVAVGPEVVSAVRRARERGAPVVAVGTTVLRALESAKRDDDPRLVRVLSGSTRLLVQPGYAFGPVDALLTNFHMPKSTLMALVAAFAGRERILSAYGEALEAGYRFLSYGDAMWIPERFS
jgi:S-adenosylmethionine:tRNA ribosyltransferase-isomerase